MSKKLHITALIVLSALTLILLSLNISLALFSDKTDGTGIVQFKQHKLDIEIVEADSIVLSTNELTIGNVSTRTINIKNPTNSTSCVFRVWLEFYVNEKIDESYLFLNLGDKFTTGEDGKYYYNNLLASGGEINNLVLTFKVNEEADAKLYQNKTYDLKLCIESIQSTKYAIENDWENSYPVSWYEGLKNNLT